MIQLKLRLNSKKPATVYAVNGKTYSLKPGSNTLNLEYEEYLSLAKALGIKPVENKKDEVPAPVTEVKEDPKPTEECAPIEDTTVVEEAKEEPVKVEESLVAEKECDTEEVSTEEQALETEPKNNITEETTDTKEVDYSTWTLKQLKAKYKELTGETCRLKKDDVISFLQEHHA